MRITTTRKISEKDCTDIRFGNQFPLGLAYCSRQSHDSMSAEAGPVAHKPLFRVQVSPFLPGGSPVQLRGATATSGCARLRYVGAIDINPGQTPGGCLSTATVLRYCGGGPERGRNSSETKQKKV